MYQAMALISLLFSIALLAAVVLLRAEGKKLDRDSWLLVGCLWLILMVPQLGYEYLQFKITQLIGIYLLALTFGMFIPAFVGSIVKRFNGTYEDCAFSPRARRRLLNSCRRTNGQA